MEQPPYIDEHRQRVDAPADVVWAALLKVLRRELGGSAPTTRSLGCDPTQGTAEFAGRPGEAVPGFRVVEAESGWRLALRGRHRFSNYALTFVPTATASYLRLRHSRSTSTLSRHRPLRPSRS
jgi:hypothetical protein